MELTDAHVLMLAEAGVLLAAHADQLSEFEVETVSDVASRFFRHHRDAVVTSREWAVVEDAIEAMRKAAGGSPLQARPAGGLWQGARGSWR